MPTPEDDYVTHRHQTDDLGWFDRFYVNVHSPKSGMTLSVGMGRYPQNEVVDGFSLLVDGATQRNFRVSREGSPDEKRIAAGPLSAEVVEPLRTWRLRLDENESKLAYDLTFHGDLVPIDVGRMHRRSRRTGALLDFSHFVQVGRVEGRIAIDGQRHEITPDSWLGLRDRSWGIRPGAGHVPNDEAPSATAGKHDWVLARVGDSAAFYFLGGGGGRPPVFLGAGVVGPKGAENVVSVERTLDWDPDGRFRGSHAVLATESGRKLELSAAAPRSTLYLRAGLYGGLDGKVQGQRRGPLVVEADEWRLDDRDLLAERTGLNDHVCEFRSTLGSGFGIYEVASGI
ncbi:MAG: hypothetical protein ACREQJ_15710 [Candidatus Binatia bacterium]